MKPRTLIKFRKLPLTIAILTIIACFLNIFINLKFITITGFILTVFNFLSMFLFWQCPYCKLQLPIKFDVDNNFSHYYTCPHCGKKIE